LGKWNYYKAEAVIIISGKVFTLMFQPYQMPVSVDGLRIYIEGVKSMGYDRSLHKEVRFSVCLENEPWGIPSELEFPVNDYRFRSGSYNNTWSSLVPFNSFRYYHMGEDIGAIPDKLDVCSWADGEIVKSPLPDGDNSNKILIRDHNGIGLDYYHCNLASIDTGIITGRPVKKGQKIAKTGMTLDGRLSQWMDPHVHTGMNFNGYEISLYPYFIEAYFRKYDDKLLDVAGGYRFANACDSIELDASRSICRDKEKIKSYQWRLHDGTIVNQPVTKVKYPNPGFYSEELLVETERGDIDKDFLQIRVNDINSTKDYAWGWAYYSPVRNIKPGQSILFWNRIVNIKADMFIDFGDGTVVHTIKEEIYHSYNKSGNYTVELSSKGINNEPVSVKLEVIIN
jgi:murein DD-endopeptidase MepM/ murein hydrolase activator NlpD